MATMGIAAQMPTIAHAMKTTTPGMMAKSSTMANVPRNQPNMLVNKSVMGYP